MRYDLLDCHVTVCAAMVPSLLTDNFDYQTINDLIHGVLGNQEVCYTVVGRQLPFFFICL